MKAAVTTKLPWNCECECATIQSQTQTMTFETYLFRRKMVRAIITFDCLWIDVPIRDRMFCCANFSCELFLWMNFQCFRVNRNFTNDWNWILSQDSICDFYGHSNVQYLLWMWFYWISIRNPHFSVRNTLNPLGQFLELSLRSGCFFEWVGSSHCNEILDDLNMRYNIWNNLR